MTPFHRLAALGLLAGCTAFPELDARIPEAERAAPPPPLVDVVPLLARADAATHRISPEAGAVLRAEAAALQGRAAARPSGTAAPGSDRLAGLAARAEALRAREAIDPATRDRLEAGVALPPALQ
ncbi:hypothetical protein [Limimaricola pyoseonensis]|uniref:Uncharacterized protein n=1 Tax=Limimaricola pyoseonensis TaxID=521013 RepID=A0A1G7CN98_9RHOB|nr:hypothetical protein [Limimaricola pyoseonensis]SDE40792.1 hypothetical protein SAMN04488567_1572 [Limimaricola pyoseonensis]